MCRTFFGGFLRINLAKKQTMNYAGEGIFVGLVLAVLLAPRKGNQTRNAMIFLAIAGTASAIGVAIEKDSTSSSSTPSINPSSGPVHHDEL